MNDLIERLKKATGPDKDLDGEIYCAVNGLTFKSVGRDGSIRFEPDAQGTHTMVTPHRYTESLDLALELVPDMPRNASKDYAANWWWSMEMLGRAKGHPKAAYIAKVYNAEGRVGFQCCDTPALAMCAAALEARFVAAADTPK